MNQMQRPGSSSFFKKNCGIPGHWARDCRKPRKERRKEAHLAQAEEVGVPVLLMAQVCSLELGTLAAPHAVYLNKEKVVPKEAGDGAWHAETGASSHMTGSKDMFARLRGRDGARDGPIQRRSLLDICCKGTLNSPLCSHSSAMLNSPLKR